jgi:outer membrane biosynthesis protein TonB
MHRLLLSLSLLLLTRQQAAFAFPSGAGQCLVGQASVGPPHLPATQGDGSLSFFKLQVLIDGAVLDPTKPFTLTKGKAHTVEIKATGDSFKGFLISASSTAKTDFTTAWTADDATGQAATACLAPIGGVTHRSAELKASAKGTLLVDTLTDLKLDVTVVMERTGSSSAFGWAQYAGNVVVEQQQAPTKAPTKKPVASPTTTASPVKPPTKAPATAPVKPPTKAPATAPVKPPTKAPTKAPATAPVKPPTKAPTKWPTSLPTVPTENRGNGGNGNGNNGGSNTRVQGGNACYQKVRSQCPCRRPRTFRCARRVARAQCQRARSGSSSTSRQAFVRAVREKFGAYCRRTAPRNRNGNADGGYY